MCGGGGGGGGLNRVYVEKKKNNLALGSAVVQKHSRYSVRVRASNSSMHQNSNHINQDPTTLC